MTHTRSPLHGFFSTDLDAVAAALDALDESCGAVTNTELPLRRRDGSGYVYPRNTLWSQATFGPVRDLACACGAMTGEASRDTTCGRCGTVCGSSQLRRTRWGHVTIAPHLHPAAVPAIADALAMTGAELARFARAELVLAGDTLLPFADNWEADRPTGPSGVRELLSRRRADHPLLRFASIERMPVPPAAERPFVEAIAATMVDPWIGPLNELWRHFVVAAGRELRLRELAAPPVILVNEAGMVQRALEQVWSATREPPKAPGPVTPPAPSTMRLVPPLASPIAEFGAHDAIAMHQLVFVDETRLVVQRPSEVRVVDTAGRVLHELPPAGCKLVGVHADRVAVFHEYLGATHPYLGETVDYGPAHLRRDDDGTVVFLAETCGELSALDAIDGRYLDEAPADMPRTFLANDQPEDLMLGEQRVLVGGDRPVAIATSRDLRFAWAGEEGSDGGTLIFELATGIPHASPIEPELACDRLDLATGERIACVDPDEPDEDCDDRMSPAIGFDGTAWWVLSSSGVLTRYAREQMPSRPVRLLPVPQAGAFDPGAGRLACLADDELIYLELSTLTVSRVRLGG